MQIVLMRHGKPKIDTRRRLNAAEFGVWVEQYNAAGIDTECLPTQEAVAQASQCAFIVCSNLPRSLESANALEIERIGAYSHMFREMDMPHAVWRFPSLSLQAWLVFFRLSWALGYSANAESFKSAKARARSCAEQLANLALTHGTVLFVGHGSLNWFVARYLKRMGGYPLTIHPRNIGSTASFTCRQHNMALNLAPLNRWALRDKSAQRRLDLRYEI